MSARSYLSIRAVAMRALVVVGAFALGGLVGACGDLEDELDGEPCTVVKDCWHTQECARTVEEAFLDLPGVCKPEGTGCLPGQQLGCTCVPTDPSMNCALPALPYSLQQFYPKMLCDQQYFRCVIAPPEDNQ
jgi:hypothetical protein